MHFIPVILGLGLILFTFAFVVIYVKTSYFFCLVNILGISHVLNNGMKLNAVLTSFSILTLGHLSFPLIPNMTS